MHQVKSSPLVLFVALLWMVGCCSAEESTDCGESGELCQQKKLDFFSNSTNVTDFAYGLTANMAAVVLYGSTFVPVKRIETGDGMFYHWVSCASIWIVSLLGEIVFQSPKFHPIAMLGGFIWATGSITVVTIVKAIGLGLGILIWGSSSLLMGWASSRFGWFGIDPQDVSKPILNYCGAGLCLISGLIFFFVKSDVGRHSQSETTPLLLDRRTISGSYGRHSSEYWIDAIGPRNRRIIGCVLAVVSGLLYGSSFVPILYIKNHSSCPDSIFYKASVYDLDYVHAQTSGVFVGSTLYFIIYCAAMKSKPRVYSRAILPGFLSGLMWTVGTYCWFLANNYLTSVITFPLVTAGYGLVAALWGSLVFKEIKGAVNCSIFFLASCVVLAGSLLTVFSKF
ncbi:transmembrane protein 144b [Austrofundulus limnaeus]|uniref:Transmembrane protein 144b n=1 Tax=Austrofundulus limnaeus TaxID=52670 RepID=A0A2I4APM7_AUSLI|nr:PREDICTED: transmembrane protein 144 [Austrofundulus limnaeus]